LKYDGTPEEVCRNFRDHAFEALNDILMKHKKTAHHDKIACERAMHFFDEALATGWKEYQALFTIYMGRAKLNLLIGQFGKCKEDCLEALKIKGEDEVMWLILGRSRFFVDKWKEGLEYVNTGLTFHPKSEKLLHLKKSFITSAENEIIVVS